MISNELLRFIQENLEQHKLKTVLFIGDQYQLPPIDEGQNGVVSLPKQYKLTEIVRQAKDSYVKMIANEIKECIKNERYTPILDILNANRYPKLKIFLEQTEFLQEHTKKDKWYEHHNKVLAYSNDAVDDQNRILRYKYWTDQGVAPDGWVIPGELLIANTNYKNLIMNSETIKVLKSEKLYDKYLDIYYWQCIDTLGRSFAMVDPDYTITYNEKIKELANKANKLDRYKEPEKRKKAWRNYFITKEKYGDFKYVFASTIHKSQGSTFNKVYINMGAVLSLINRNDKDIAYRLLYVAVTRASKDVILLS